MVERPPMQQVPTRNIKARGLASPDLGDTLAMTLYVHLNQRIRERKELV